MVTVDVGTLINQQTAAVANTAGLADGFLANLLLTANVAFSDGFNIDNILPNGYNYASVPQVYVPIVAGGIRPDISNLPLVGAPDAPSIDFSTFVPIVLPTDDLTTPTAVFQFAEGTYDRTLLDPWRAKLLNDLVNGSYGIDTNDELSLLNRVRDREVELASTRIEAASRAMATRGFPLPPGELAIQIDRAYQDMQDKVSGTNREIYIKRADQFIDARKFTITEVREMEQILIAFYNAVQERALNVAKSTFEFSIALFNSLIARYRARIEAALGSANVQRYVLEAEAAKASAYVELFKGKIAAYEANLRRVIDTARVQVEAYGIDIQADRVLNDGQVAVASLQQEVLKSTVQQNIQISNVAVENAKAKLLATVEGLKFRAGASQYASEKFFSQLTAMVGTINTLAVQSQSS